MLNQAWEDAFQELWNHAAHHRGMRETAADGPGHPLSDALHQWPRTCGADVIAIASIVDAVLRTAPLTSGGHGVERTWRRCARELEHGALGEPGREYRHNRAFWSALASTCPNRVSVREDIVRHKVIQGIQDYMLSDEGVAQFRKRIAEELRDYSRNIEARRKECVERLARTEEKIRGLIEFIATGDRSEYVVAMLRDLEAFARSEKAALAELAEEANRPLRLPSIEEVTALATDLEARLTEDPELGREALRRWLHEGRILVDQGPDGPTAQGELLPLMVLVDGSEKAARKSGGGGGGIT